MSSIIKIKRSEVSGNPAVLGAGELAYSALADNGSNGGDRLYIGMGTETAGNAVNHVVIGGKYFTDQITGATSLNTASALVRRDASGNFAANIITAALAGNATTASAWLAARSISITGDATWTTSVDGSANATGALTLAASGVVSGTYGSATLVPSITVDSKGRVTGVTTNAISTALSISGTVGTDTVQLGTDTLVFEGGTGVTTTVTDNKVSFAIGQAVGPSNNVTFNNVTVNGSLNSDDITAANISVAGNATITGNLTVQGTTTTINSTALAVSDVNITLAKDATTAAAANGAGLTVAGPTTPATFTYTSADDRWNLNKDLTVATVYGALSGNAATATKLATARTINGVAFDGTADINITSVLSNALTIGTGLSGTSYNGSAAVTIAVDSTIARRADVAYIGTTGVALNSASGSVTTLAGLTSVTSTSFVGALTGNASTATALATARSITATGDASWTVSFSGSAAVSAALTLVTVNSNIGSFGSGTVVPTVTVNAKGLVTGVSTTPIPTATASVLGLAKFDSTNFVVTAGAVAIATVDGGTY